MPKTPLRPLVISFFLALAHAGPSAHATALIYSNDVLGELEPCGCRNNPTGGLIRKAGLLEKIRNEKKDTSFLQLDGGDLLFDAAALPENLKPQAELQARELIAAHDALGHDAFVPGEKDFALGTRKLKNLLKGAKFRAISANLQERKTGKPLFAGSAIFKRGKQRIAVIGLSGADLDWPKDIQASSPVEAFKREWKKIQGRGPRPATLIALTHQGLEADRELARAVPDIDIIVGGHSQSFLQKPEREGRPDGPATWIFQSSFRNQWVGVLPLDGKGKPAAEAHELLPLDSSYDPPAEKDPYGMKARVSRLKEQIARLNQKNAEKQAKLVRNSSSLANHQTFPRCAECHLRQLDFWRKTPHGNSYAVLLEAGQARNQECIGCHSAGFMQKGGWSDITKPAERTTDTQVRSLSPEQLQSYIKTLHSADSLKEPVKLEEAAPEKVTLVAATRQLSKVWGNVQCENCHHPAGDHPFGESPYPKQVGTETCLKCHTQARAPNWYDAQGKLLQGRLEESRKKVGCPAGQLDEENL